LPLDLLSGSGPEHAVLFGLQLCLSQWGSVLAAQGLLFTWFSPFGARFSVVIATLFVCVWSVAGTRPGLTLELPDQKARGCLVEIALPR
jgi:hypothetical protein